MIFSAASLKTAFEHAIVAGAAAFVASFSSTQQLTLHDLENAGIAALVGTIYAFVKQLGGVQTVTQALKVKVAGSPPGVHSAG